MINQHAFSFYNLHVVLPDFGGPMTAIFIGTTGLGVG